MMPLALHHAAFIKLLTLLSLTSTAGQDLLTTLFTIGGRRDMSKHIMLLI